MVLGSAGYRCSFSGSSFLFCMNTVYSKTTNFFVQTGPLTIGTWAALCGVFAIFCSAVFYGAYGKNTVGVLEERVFI